ncbi:MAG TPA: OmpA family protein [Neisseria sp.]|nr:OmpA family protein [Neisseria sp.]
MSIDLGNLLQSQLGSVLGQFLTNSGEAEESSGKATGLAIPAIVAGLVKHVSGNPTNASGLFDLITGTAGNSLTGAVSQAAEGSNLGSLIDLGKSLLPNLLGGNAADVADQISQQSGVSKASAGSLLSLALPLVLSVLRGQAKEGNLNQGQLLGLLAQQQGWLSQVLDSNMLSALGIGSLSGIFGGLNNLISGLGNAGAAVAGGAAAATAAAKKGGNGKWIALAVAAVLALLAFKSCGNGEQAAAPAASEPAASAVSEALAEVASAPAAASEASAPAPVAADNARVVYENGVATFFFATGKNDVAEGAQTIVADVINAGKDGKKLVVSGFADSTGNAAANEELSKQRAQAVQAFFEAQGVNAANIELRKPESTTGAVGNDVEGRRVEVKVEG